MASEAQIAANRENSKKSTGPKTAEGKAAVSKNAVKHGLFDEGTVINGEDQGQFDEYWETFMAELCPVGAMESLLAERFVSLAWRLRRAERMQNQAIDEMIDYLKPSPIEWYERATRPPFLRSDELKFKVPEPNEALGRVARRDCAGHRLLERLLLYERRLENSLFRTKRELQRLQKERRDEQAGANSCRGRLARASRGRAAHDSTEYGKSNARALEEQTGEDNRLDHHHRCELKSKRDRGRDALGTRGRDVRDTKQSQFAAPRTSAKLSLINGYDDERPASAAGNKANRSPSNSTVSDQAPSNGRISRPPGSLDMAGVAAGQSD